MPETVQNREWRVSQWAKRNGFRLDVARSPEAKAYVAELRDRNRDGELLVQATSPYRAHAVSKIERMVIRLQRATR